MARYTDRPFRALCKRCGADVMVSEFVQADSLIHGGPRAWRTVDFSEDQRPMGVQIFGSSATSMARAARLLVERVAPDFIDLNFGCPAAKVTCKNGGSSLLKDPPALAAIVREVVAAVPETPVCAKIRIGWDAANVVAVDVARRVEDAGAAGLAIHGRTKEQGYRGEADWEVIAAAVRAVDMPVIGNGGIGRETDLPALRRETGVRGFMIGRAALGYPWLFAEIKARLAGQAGPSALTPEARWECLLAYAGDLVAYYEERQGNLRGLRAKLKALTREMPGGKHLRVALDRVETLEDLRVLREGSLAASA